MMKVDLCVIGAGSGGLYVAAGAAQLGVKTVLIEKGKMGGDCLNYGCVPSKALIAAAKKAHAINHSGGFGVTGGPAQVDFEQLHTHVRSVIAAIEPHDSVERFEGLGAIVLQGAARFVGPNQVEVNGQIIKARRIVVATGSSPFVPPIDGLNQIDYFTNETIFDNKNPIAHLAIVGGGPIGMEMAQAFCRLGVKVTVLERARILPKDDADLVAIVGQTLRAEGVDIREGADVLAVGGQTGALELTIEQDGVREVLPASHLLVAAGRRPNVDGLNLEAAQIEYEPSGIKTDERLRTTNKKVFAIGDVRGGLQFTHMAGYEGGIVVRNALFRVPAKASASAIPWTTYTDPELAHVGESEASAKAKNLRHKVLHWPFKDNDRAQAERRTEGLIKVIVSPRGAILGASICGAGAGELIQPWVLAVSSRLKIGAFTSYVPPYPTLGEVSKRAAGSFYSSTLFSPRTRFLVRFLSWFG